jgi:transcriptional regulator with XRE-family HTH domain
MTIGERIRNRRIELNMTQEELAKKAGYKSRSSINKIELSRDLPLNKIAVVAKALDCSPSYLAGWTDEAQDTINRISDKLDHIKCPNTSFFDEIKNDPIFMENIILLFSLPQEKRKEVYTFIQFKYYEIDENHREKESNLGS